MAIKKIMNFPELESAAKFFALPDDARLALSQRIADSMGEGFVPLAHLHGPEKLSAVVHQPTRCEFVAVFGGEFQMGLSDDDIEELSEYVSWTNGVAEFIQSHQEQARPVHRVAVAPFLVSIGIIRDPMWGVEVDESEGDRAEIVLDLLNAAPQGIRLPSEAELEYLIRSGGSDAFLTNSAQRWQQERKFPAPHPWGIYDLEYGQWAADSWHDNYNGAPSTGEAWEPHQLPEVFRGMLPDGPVQDDEEIILALAALRGKAAVPVVDQENDSRHFFIRLAVSLA